MPAFQPFLSIQLFHDYYTNRKPADLQIQPDADTQTWMQSAGLRIQQREDTFHVVAPEAFDLQKQMSNSPDLQLHFEVRSSHPEFFTFTDMPLDAQQQLIYTYDGTLELTQTIESGPSGILIKLQLSQISSDTEQWPIRYTLSLKARATRWKYLISPSNLPPNKQIKLAGSSAALFTGPTPTQLPNGTTAIVYDSGDHLIPLKENNSIDLNLKLVPINDSQSVGEDFISSLPTASNQLDFNTVDGELEFFSSIYVHL